MQVMLMTFIPVRHDFPEAKIGVVDCENGRIFKKQTRKLSFKWGGSWIVLTFEIK